MNKSKTIVFIILCAMLACGIYLSNWWGGALFGAASCMLLLQQIGQKIAAKAAKQIDKNVRDIIIHQTE